MGIYNKAAVAVTTAVAASAPLVRDGITIEEGITIFLAFMGALGVYAVKNADKPTR